MKIELIIIALIGIIYLISIQEPEIKLINELRDNEYARINGTIMKCIRSDHLTIMNVTDYTGNINTIFFSKTECVKGALIQVTGRKGIYENEVEFKGVRIKYLNYSYQQ